MTLLFFIIFIAGLAVAVMVAAIIATLKALGLSGNMIGLSIYCLGWWAGLSLVLAKTWSDL